ncbi:MAG: beta-ketoacyl-ACP synthase II [Acidimicrobiales bacterium]|jgi:3-oxoacyl-[acyl-carrier-protein] synthase II|nr:beta-ketoacyl-ACP synthase II [Actinomycetes bacterium]MDP6241216.1 beta-ketoacyl-ACP synthase II [Acidimicrobiales bacterium]MDP7124639.1 beta-ketoacyl-ACP synthase II [Acidimicrobiales bacterium]MDP7507032.1 beta-ketoacyl-ACP synthase II [Acidimicrobiales bacterium]|tara:strand:- start:29029 stop:30201 length:1173 start_codon:yes stop_codon:yes gene_type:complete
MQGRRVAVTGLGVVAPCGIGVDAFWEGLCGPAPEGDRRVHDFDPSPWFDNPKEARRADRCTQFAIAAADMALEQAGTLTADPGRRGVWIGTGIGGIQTLEEQIRTRLDKGERRVSPFLVPMMMANAPSAAVSMRHGFQGPAENSCTACAAGTHAVANAARLVASGRCDVMVAGGSEAAFVPTALAGFRNMTAFSSVGLSKPFDAERDGFVMGEGAGILILEEWETALERGATIVAEVLGGASTADAHHITAPSPGGVGAIACMELAMEEAGVTAADVGHINAHGTSTPLNDMAEARAMEKVFGIPGPLVTSTKGITGHALGAAGALEAVALALSLHKALIPPTAGYTTPDPEMPPVNLVTGDATPWEPAPALSNSFGFGGHNGTIVMGPA